MSAYHRGYNWNIDGHPMVIPAHDGRVTFKLVDPDVVLYNNPYGALGNLKARIHKTHINVSCELVAEGSSWTALEEKEPIVAQGISLSLGSSDGSSGVEPLQVHLRASGDFPYGPADLLVSKGVRLVPPLPGVWKYGINKHLVFTPESRFAPGTSLSLELSEFPGVTFNSSLEDSITVARPQLHLSSVSTYQEPDRPDRLRITGVIDLSYPLARGSLESLTDLYMRVEPQKDYTNARTLGFEISYSDENPQIAYLKSETFAIPEEPASVRIRVRPGVFSSLGGSPTEYSTIQEVKVRGRSEYFQITDAEISDAITKDGDVERIIALSSSIPLAKPAQLAESIEVFLLPDCALELEKRNELCKAKDLETWSAEEEVDPRVISASVQLPVTWKSEIAPEKTTNLLSFSAPENRQVLLRVKAGLSGTGEFKLSKDYRQVFEFGELKRELRIMHEGSLLSLSGDKRLGITARGVEGIRVGLRRLATTDLHHIVSLSYGKFQAPYFELSLDHFSEEFAYDDQMPLTKELARQYSSIDFSKFVKDKKVPKGLFLLTLRSRKDVPPPPDVSRLDEREAQRRLSEYKEKIARVETCTDTQSDEEYEDADENKILCDQRLVLITDTGILVKRGATGEDDVYVMSFRTGQPIPGAKVTLIGKNGAPIFEGMTGADGSAHFPSATTLANQREPTTYVVEKGGDLSFLPYRKEDRRIDVSRFETGGVYDMDEFNSLQAYLFTDRGICRPGDQARFGLILRKRGFERLPTGLPLQLSITDPRSKEVHRQKVEFDSTGFSEILWDTLPGGATGSYRAELRLMGADSIGSLANLGGTSFRVEEFQPDKLNVKTEIINNTSGNGTQFIEQKDAQVKVVVRNLFGTPAIGNKVSAELSVRPWRGFLPAYPGYQLRETVSTTLPTTAENLGETVTNEDGEAIITLGLEKFQEPIYEFFVAGEGYEKGSGRSVVSVTQAIASALPTLLGYKADGDLDFISLGSIRNVNLIAVNRNGVRENGGTFSFEIYEHHYESTLVKQPNGLYAYQSVEQVISKETGTITIPLEGVNYLLPTREAGRYRMIIRSSDGTDLLSYFFSVAGDGNVTMSLEKSAELSILLDRPEYNIGDEISVNIVSPYTGAGLLTIESDKVYASHWFQTTTTSSTQKIRVPEGYRAMHISQLPSYVLRSPRRYL